MNSIAGALYAHVDSISEIEGEEEILFSMHSRFRIVQIKDIGGINQIQEVELTSASDNDPD